MCSAMRPHALGRRCQRICASHIAWQLQVGDSWELLDPMGWLCRALPVLTPLLSPQVVPESGAWERERDAAQQAGQVRLLHPVLCLAGDPLAPGNNGSSSGMSCCVCRCMACVVRVLHPEPAEPSTPYTMAAGLGWTLSSDKLNRILHRCRAGFPLC